MQWVFQTAQPRELPFFTQGPKIRRHLSRVCRSPVESSLAFRGFAPGIKIHRWDRSMDRSIRTVRQIEQVVGPYRVMFQELKENNQQLPLQCFCRGKKNAKNTMGTTTLTEGRRNGLPLVIQIRGNRRVKTHKRRRWVAQGVQSGAAKLGTN
jgi:hypothetical protein